MDFDFDQIPVPFGMRPGLRRLDPATPQLTPLDPGSRLWAEKSVVFKARQSRHGVPGFDPAPALRAIADRADGTASHRGAFEDSLELAFEEDLAVLDGATGTLPWLCVCVPSHWAPEDKLGLDFAALHAPVADNAALIAASRQLVALVTAGERWERMVWTVSPSGRYDQHPRRQGRTPWPAAQDPDAVRRPMLAARGAPDFLSGRPRHSPGRLHDSRDVAAADRVDPDAMAGRTPSRLAGLDVAGSARLQESHGRPRTVAALAGREGRMKPIAPVSKMKVPVVFCGMAAFVKGRAQAGGRPIGPRIG